jgi:hypothetical protein
MGCSVLQSAGIPSNAPLLSTTSMSASSASPTSRPRAVRRRTALRSVCCLRVFLLEGHVCVYLLTLFCTTHSLPPRPLRDPVRRPQALVHPQINRSPPTPMRPSRDRQSEPASPQDIGPSVFSIAYMASIDGGCSYRRSEGAGFPCFAGGKQGNTTREAGTHTHTHTHTAHWEEQAVTCITGRSGSTLGLLSDLDLLYHYPPIIRHRCRKRQGITQEAITFPANVSEMMARVSEKRCSFLSGQAA